MKQNQHDYWYLYIFHNGNIQQLDPPPPIPADEIMVNVEINIYLSND